MNVLCTLPMHPAGMALLTGHAEITVMPDASDEAFVRLLPNADFLVVRTKLPSGVFIHGNRLKGVIRHGTGLDFIPVEEASALSIPVANVPGANAQAVAEYCLASMLRLARGVDRIERRFREQGWDAGRQRSTSAGEIAGKTVGIIGLGTVGQKLARLCHLGFDMRVLGHQPTYAGVPEYIVPTELDALLRESDFVVLCCPLTDETQGLLNAERLSRMRPEAVLVNAARGPIVEEEALMDALRSHRIKGAALDVYAQHPMGPDHPLLKFDNVFLTPHIAGLTQESTASMSVGTARQILQLMRGERPDHLVNPEIWTHRRKIAETQA